MVDLETLTAGVVWVPPWRPVLGEERRRLVVQLARELSCLHPLSLGAPRVIGVRDGSDQILVRVKTDLLVIVQLDWTAGPGFHPEDLPATMGFRSSADFMVPGKQAQVDQEFARLGSLLL